MGFTILELVLVVALIGLAAGFIGPRVGKILDLAAYKEEYKTFYNWLKKAQATAVIEGVTCEVRVKGHRGDRYWITYTKDGKRVELVNIIMVKTNLVGDYRFYFTPTGGVEPGNKHTIIFGPSGSTYPQGWKQVEIEPWGEISIIDLG